MVEISVVGYIDALGYLRCVGCMELVLPVAWDSVYPIYMDSTRAR
jgi:hypothetical protein